MSDLKLNALTTLFRGQIPEDGKVKLEVDNGDGSTVAYIAEVKDSEIISIANEEELVLLDISSEDDVKIEDETLNKLIASGEEAVAKEEEAELRNDLAIARAQQLHAAMDRAGTDEKAVRNIIENVKGQDLVDVADAYKKLYGKSLEKAIKKDFSWASGEKALLKLLKTARDMADKTPREDLSDPKKAKEILLDAKVSAFKAATTNRLGTDEKVMSEILLDMSKAEIEEFAKYYEEKTGKSLKEVIKSETSCEFEDMLLRKLNHSKDPQDYSNLTNDEKRTKIAEVRATILYEAMKGKGTNEKAVEDILKNVQGKDLVEVKAAYERLFNETLEQAINDDFSAASDKYNLLAYITVAENYQDVEGVQTKDEDLDDALAKANAKLYAQQFLKATNNNTWTIFQLGTDENKIYDLIISGALTDEEIVAMAKELKSQGRDIRYMIASELNFDNLEQITHQALLAKLDRLGVE